MAKIKGWKKMRDGMWDARNGVSFVTIDPDMDSKGEVFWVLHIRNKDYQDFIITKPTKKDVVDYAIMYMRGRPNG